MCKDITFVMTCPICHKQHSVATSSEAYNAWQSGELIQDAMPFLTSIEQEQLVSNLCPECQEELFSTEEEEDWEPGDIDSDCGFDPYCGCYTDDC